MSQTGTPTEFLQLGITEPDDTLNVLVDLNGQWRKIDTGVKNVDTKATTNAGNIATLQGAVQDNTENITNILDTNVNQQNSIDTLQTKVAVLEEDDTSYGSRITAVENGVQENSELINDLEVDLSGVKLDIGTVPSGSNLQGEVDGLDTRVTALENSGSVAAVEARVTALETEVGTVPAGETVQGQISDLDTDVTTLQGQVNSGNIPFRFSVDGGGNYGYLKADDSFVPFSSGSGHWHELDTTLFVSSNTRGFIIPYNGYRTVGSEHYGMVHDFIHDVDYSLPFDAVFTSTGCVGFNTASKEGYLINSNNFTLIGTVMCAIFDRRYNYTHYITRNGNNCQYNVVDSEGASVGLPCNFVLAGTPTSPIIVDLSKRICYRYNNTVYLTTCDTETGTANTTTGTGITMSDGKVFVNTAAAHAYRWDVVDNTFTNPEPNKVLFDPDIYGTFLVRQGSKYYYYV